MRLSLGEKRKKAERGLCCIDKCACVYAVLTTTSESTSMKEANKKSQAHCPAANPVSLLASIGCFSLRNNPSRCCQSFQHMAFLQHVEFSSLLSPHREPNTAPATGCQPEQSHALAELNLAAGLFHAAGWS